LPRALEDLQHLYDFLEAKDPVLARQAMAAIVEATNALCEFPGLGRLLQRPTQARALRVPFGTAAYVIHYKVEGTEIVVLRAWHSREAR
jgi:plasmid stabilization system protein ParE